MNSDSTAGAFTDFPDRKAEYIADFYGISSHLVQAMKGQAGAAV